MILRSDDFTRANSTTLIGSPSDGGSAYTVLVNSGGLWGISSNQGYHPGGSGTDFAALDAGTADVEVSCKWPTQSVRSGLAARVVDLSNAILVNLTTVATGSLELFSRSGGTNTSRGTYSLGSAIAGTSVVAIRCVGDQISVKLDGTTVIGPVTISGYTSTLHGLCIVAGTGSTARWDDLSIGDVAAAGGAIATKASHLRRMMGVA